MFCETLTRRAQLVCNSPDSLQDKTDHLNNILRKNNYNADFVRRNPHSNANSITWTNINYLCPCYGSDYTVHQRHLWIDCTYTTTLKHMRCTHTDDHLKTTAYWWQRTKTDQRTDKEQYTRSNATTTRSLTLVRLVETLARDSLNTSKRQEMVSDVYNHIAEHHVETKPQIVWPWGKPLNLSQQLPAL